MRLVIGIGLALIAQLAFAEEDSCAVVLERAAANISYRFGSATAASTQANALCDERYEKMSSSEQQGVEASYKLFSGSYSSAGSSLKEYRSKYCSAGKSSFFSASQSTDYSSQIYDASVSAWRDCKALQSANVIISPVRTPDDRSITFSVAYRGPGAANLTGVRISPQGSFSCTADGGKKVDGPTNLKLSGNSLSFSCDRVVQEGSGPGAFTAGASSITVTTTATTRPFMVYFPAVANPDILSENAASLRKAVDELKIKLAADTASVSSRIDQVALTVKFGGAYSQSDPPWQATSTNQFKNPLTNAFNCPAGFTPIQAGRYRGAEPEVGHNLYICMKS